MVVLICGSRAAHLVVLGHIADQISVGTGYRCLNPIATGLGVLKTGDTEEAAGGL